MKLMHRNALLASAAALGLAACQNSASFNAEAGALVDRQATFGNATMNNNLVQTGAQGFAVNLSRRFAAEVPTTINFDFDSAELDEQARAVLRQQAAWIRQFPELRFRVYGHTDLVGSAAYNRRLGLRRAQAAVAYLISQGISRSRLEAVSSLGETQPLIQTEGRERANRRTMTDVSGWVEEHPMVLNGQYAEVIWREYIVSGQSQSNLSGIQGSEVSTAQ